MTTMPSSTPPTGLLNRRTGSSCSVNLRSEPATFSSYSAACCFMRARRSCRSFSSAGFGPSATAREAASARTAIAARAVNSLAWFMDMASGSSPIGNEAFQEQSSQEQRGQDRPEFAIDQFVAGGRLFRGGYFGRRGFIGQLEAEAVNELLGRRSVRLRLARAGGHDERVAFPRV